MNYDFIFMITYGRSGSTLLQGILNSIEGVMVRGENHNTLYLLYQSLKNASMARSRFGALPTESRNPWWGIDLFDHEQYQDAIRDLFIRTILKPRAHHRVVGFKEIRYGEEVPDLSSYLNFMAEAFPRSCFIFNSRNLEEVAKSAWWAERPNAKSYLEKVEARFRLVYEEHRSHSTWVHYDDYVGKPAALEYLFEFLGAPFDANRVTRIMAVPHSYALRSTKVSNP